MAGTVPCVAPGEIRKLAFTIGNQGPDATKIPVRLVFTTPYYVNLVASMLPRGCKVLHSNADPLAPEAVQCFRTLRGVGRQSEIKVVFGITAVKGGPSGYVSGLAIAAEAPAGEASSHDPSIADHLHVALVNELP